MTTIRPNYYKRQVALRNHGDEIKTVECQDVIEGLELSFNLGNTLKYLWRAGQKTPNAREDLIKAKTYIDLELARLDRTEEPTP